MTSRTKFVGRARHLVRQLLKLSSCAASGRSPQQKQVGRPLEGVALAAQAADQVVDIVATIPKLALAGNLLAVPLLKGINAGDVGDTRQHALAVFVAQTAFYIVLGKKLRVNAVVGDTFLGKDAASFSMAA
mgnify:CR=1 FL=1